jgi:hypothetical protein
VRGAYVDGEVGLEELLLVFEFEAEVDIFVEVRVTEVGGGVFDESELGVVLLFLNVYFFVPHHNLKTNTFLRHALKYLALFSSVAHVVPKCERAAAVEGPPDGLTRADALLYSIQVDVGVQVLVGWALLLKNGLSMRGLYIIEGQTCVQCV